MSSAEKESRDVVVVTNLRPLRIVLLKRVAADKALRSVLILLSLLGIYALYRSSRPELLHNRRLPLDEYIQKLGEFILTDFRHRQLIVSAKSRTENGRRSAHFVLLRVCSLLYLATLRLENGFKVRRDHEQSHCAIFVVIEFKLSLYETWCREHMEH